LAKKCTPDKILATPMLMTVQFFACVLSQYSSLYHQSFVLFPAVSFYNCSQLPRFHITTAQDGDFVSKTSAGADVRARSWCLYADNAGRWHSLQ